MPSVRKAIKKFISRFRRRKHKKRPTENNGPGTIHYELARLSDTVEEKSERKAFEDEMQTFFHLYTRHLSVKYVTEEKQLKISPQVNSPSGSQIQQYSDLSADYGATRLQKLAVIKIAIDASDLSRREEIRNGMNAVELPLEHISHLNAAYGVSIPLVLVESYDNMISIDPEHHPNNVPLIRVRGSRLPRLNQNTLLPIPTSADSPNECWYTPGTGDVFDSLRRTGTLARLLDDGKDHAFVSSCDDIGALVDESIFAHVCTSQLDFLLEVTERKSGSPEEILTDCDGRLQLTKSPSQATTEPSSEAKSVVKTSQTGDQTQYRPTGSFWVDLRVLKTKLHDGPLGLDIKPVQTTVGEIGKALQLETSAISAIKHFDRTQALVVPRLRHVHVRTLADVLILRSDLYTLMWGSFVRHKPADGTEDDLHPIVKLPGECTTSLDLRRRFAQIPHMHDLEHLSVVGDVYFGKGVRLRGTVIVHAKVGERIDIPDGSILENKLIMGDLRSAVSHELSILPISSSAQPL